MKLEKLIYFPPLLFEKESWSVIRKWQKGCVNDSLNLRDVIYPLDCRYCR